MGTTESGGKRRGKRKAASAVLLVSAALIISAASTCGGIPDAYRQRKTAPGDREAVQPTQVDREDWDAWEKFREENQVEETFVNELNGFSFRTAADLLRSRQENAIYSPVSLYYALSLAAEGTAGETKEELSRYLGDGDPGKRGEQAGRLYRWLYKDNAVGKLRIATSLWRDRELDLTKPFLDTAADQYYASIYAVDFKDPGVGAHMGEWVKEQTGGTISPEIRTDGATVLHLLNTIYLRDEWIDRFERGKTKTDVFHLKDGSTVEVDFMNREYGSHSFARGDGFTRTSLGLKENGSMVFVLPDKGVFPDRFLKSAEQLAEAFGGGEEQSGEVIFKVPKFVADSHFDIREAMERAGVKRLFADGDFSAMTGDDGVFISAVSQDGHISINEDGVEASAFTDIAYAGASMPQGRAEMILDRPFLYGIKSQGVWLFIGVCDNPR